MKSKGSEETNDEDSPSHLIDTKIAELGDWRGEILARVRALIKDACPDVVEAWKWGGVPVWERDGIICTGESYKAVVKADLRPGGRAQRPFGPVQFQP